MEKSRVFGGHPEMDGGQVKSIVLIQRFGRARQGARLVIGRAIHGHQLHVDRLNVAVTDE